MVLWTFHTLPSSTFNCARRKNEVYILLLRNHASMNSQPTSTQYLRRTQRGYLLVDLPLESDVFMPLGAGILIRNKLDPTLGPGRIVKIESQGRVSIRFLWRDVSYTIDPQNANLERYILFGFTPE